MGLFPSKNGNSYINQRLSNHFDCERLSGEITVIVSEIPEFEYRNDFNKWIGIMQTSIKYQGINILIISNINIFSFFLKLQSLLLITTLSICTDVHKNVKK